MAEWGKRQYSKGEIDRAGEALVPWWKSRDVPTDETVADAFGIAQNWRTCHAYPLNAFQVNLRQRARKIEPEVIVAQRLKRFSSMMNKLSREPQMKLSQMQDLGGCRAILTSVEAVRRLAALYGGQEAHLFSWEGRLKVYDYLRNPKDDGYRGIHVVGRFSARTESREDWNGQRIETPVSGTPSDHRALVAELREAGRALRVHHRLRAWADALRTLPRKNVQGAKWMLMVLDVERSTVRVTGYADRAKAAEKLFELEQQEGGAQSSTDAVLVWVKDARNLRAAYPNYYADTRQFLIALDEALRPHRA